MTVLVFDFAIFSPNVFETVMVLIAPKYIDLGWRHHEPDSARGEMRIL